MNLKQAITGVDARLGTLRNSLSRAGAAMGSVGGGAGKASGALGGLRTAAGNGDTAIGRLRGGLRNADLALGKSGGAADRFRGSLGRLQTSLTRSRTGAGQFRTSLGQADGALGKSRTSADRFRSSLDRLKGSADRARTALRGVKQQSDEVEKSVGRAGKNADKAGRTMGGGLTKGLKGASLAQRGLNLAMAASPFGLIMTLLAPLILQFVKVDKIVAVVQKGFRTGMAAIRSATSAAMKAIGPVLRGIGNVLLAPFRGFATAVNVVIGALNRFKVSIPGWVPKFGGKSFSISLPSIPVPRLAQGGVVPARNGGTLALIGEAGESEAVIPLSKLDRMMSPGAGRAQTARLAAAVERLAERPVHVQVDSQTIARAVLAGQRQLARR
ncbi:hypothetical protein ACIOD0_16730 [Kitasatospora albolonga]|uniref:hypothetical protein n=1 Tax=Streptomyces sp. NPDC057554 TaxID=3350538 RepID=UPI003678E98F